MLSVLAALAILLQAKAADPPPPEPEPAAEPAVVTTPLWLQRPTGEDMARVYPGTAAQRGVNGRVVMICGVVASGDLTACRIDSELPKGERFGEAALRMASQFKMGTTAQDGRSVAGGEVRIPLRFVLGGGEQHARLVAAMTCYGHVANLADKKPKMTAAWQAVVYWSMEVAAASANSGLRPADFEDALAIARREERERRSPAPDGEFDTCLAKGRPAKP